MAKTLLSSLISICLLHFTVQYNATGGLCSAAGIQQSPINIVSANTSYYDETYFRILTNQYNNLDTNNTWSYDNNANAIGIVPYTSQGNFGNVIFIKDWGFVNLVLQRIHFRVGSNNQIDGKSYDAEMELVHTIDANYYSPGKRVDLGTNYVVISVPFVLTSNSDPAATSLFQWMNLGGYVNGTSPNMTRQIKLYSIVQHQPGYLYEGTLPYGDCQPAWYLQLTQYQLIAQYDYNNLVTASKNYLNSTSNTNVRSIQTTINQVYRNWNNITRLTPNLNLISFQNAETLKFSSVMYAVFSIALFLL